MCTFYLATHELNGACKKCNRMFKSAKNCNLTNDRKSRSVCTWSCWLTIRIERVHFNSDRWPIQRFHIHLGCVVKQQHIISNEIKEAHSYGFRLHLQYFVFVFYVYMFLSYFHLPSLSSLLLLLLLLGFFHRIFFPSYIINYVMYALVLRLHSCWMEAAYIHIHIHV